MLRLRTQLIIDEATAIEIHRIAGEDKASFYTQCNRLLRLGVAARSLFQLNWSEQVVRPTKGEAFHLDSSGRPVRLEEDKK